MIEKHDPNFIQYVKLDGYGQKTGPWPVEMVIKSSYDIENILNTLNFKMTIYFQPCVVSGVIVTVAMRRNMHQGSVKIKMNVPCMEIHCVTPMLNVSTLRDHSGIQKLKKSYKMWKKLFGFEYVSNCIQDLVIPH